ncbi:hypothetical protein HY251_09775 [bacterium]|nr:hypothetical protein [bacterium]
MLSSNEAVRRQVAAALAAEQINVVEAANEAAAYQELLQGTPDLVVCDSRADAGEDREALLLGTLASLGRPPFVVVATDAGEAAGNLVRKGAFCAIRFPLHAGEARAVFRRALSLRQKERERATLLTDIEAMRSFAHDALWNVMEGVLVLDGSGIVLFANPEAARILLLDPERIVGTRMDAKLGWPILNLLKLTRESPTKQAVDEFDLVSGDARLKVLARGVLICDHMGQPVGGLVVLRALDPGQPGVAGIVSNAARGAAPVPGASP